MLSPNGNQLPEPDPIGPNVITLPTLQLTLPTLLPTLPTLLPTLQPTLPTLQPTLQFTLPTLQPTLAGPWMPLVRHSWACAHSGQAPFSSMNWKAGNSQKQEPRGQVDRMPSFMWGLFTCFGVEVASKVLRV